MQLASDATPDERSEFARAALMSRFFGGSPRERVPRSEVPIGYWNNPSDLDASNSRRQAAPGPALGQIVARIRRRGC